MAPHPLRWSDADLRESYTKRHKACATLYEHICALGVTTHVAHQQVYAWQQALARGCAVDTYKVLADTERHFTNALCMHLRTDGVECVKQKEAKVRQSTSRFPGSMDIMRYRDDVCRNCRAFVDMVQSEELNLPEALRRYKQIRNTPDMPPSRMSDGTRIPPMAVRAV